MYPKMIIEIYLASNILLKGFFFEIFHIGSNKKSCNETNASSHPERSFKTGS